MNMHKDYSCDKWGDSHWYVGSQLTCARCGHVRSNNEATPVVRNMAYDDIVKSSVDPKACAASKKLCFDAVPVTLKILATAGNQSGADKYGIFNWLKLEDGSMSLNTYINALERHLILFRAGQDYTSDTNIHNLDSMIAGLAVVRDAMIFGKVKDDRVKLSDEQIKILEALINKEIKA